jgi:hypothetical protein
LLFLALAANTWLGTIVNIAAPAPAAPTNCLLPIFRVSLLIACL